MLEPQYVDQLLNCDCVEAMQQLPDQCIPLTVTSPPYDDLRSYGGHAFDVAKFQAVAKELFRITMRGGVVAWVVRDAIAAGSETGTSVAQRLHFTEIGFSLHNRIIMGRTGCRTPSPLRYGGAIEEALVLSKGRPRTINLLRDKRNTTAGDLLKKSYRTKGGVLVTKKFPGKQVREFGVRSNIWMYTVGSGHTSKDKFAFGHPALMPEAMGEDLIVSWSRPSDLVFDPFAGAGTTCKMALLNHRRYLGVEIVDEYCQIARKRLRLAQEEYRRRLDEFLSP